MFTISFARHQFPPAVIRHAVWLYDRFTLSYRDVEELLAERGLDVSYETVRRWLLKFGPLFCPRASPPSLPPDLAMEDSAKYAATGGWGFAQFDDGKPASEMVQNTCF